MMSVIPRTPSGLQPNWRDMATGRGTRAHCAPRRGAVERPQKRKTHCPKLRARSARSPAYKAVERSQRAPIVPFRLRRGAHGYLGAATGVSAQEVRTRTL